MSSANGSVPVPLSVRPWSERDACGIGFVADVHGRSSRGIVDAALEGLAGVRHRGAMAADERSADGCGLLLAIPPAVFGAGRGVLSLMVRGALGRAEIEGLAAEEGVTIEAWRQPPVEEKLLGRVALDGRPALWQAVLAPLDHAGGCERRAFRLRRRIAVDPRLGGTYVVSCSWRTVVYKALVAADELAGFYPDLADPAVEASFAVFHQRFSTNTAPSWERAQPFRMSCHNGEINAITANLAAMQARSVLGTDSAGLGPEDLYHPVLSDTDSDSGMLDAALELLVRAGRDSRHAVAMLVPAAWEGDRGMDAELRAFYRYHSCLAEPWDGPAGIVFTDGVGVGAALDRNGLRPLRYALCEDGLVVCCSEAGALDLKGRGAVTRGRLGPGQMLFVDPTRGLLLDGDCKARLAAGAPYGEWVRDGLASVDGGAPLPVTGGPSELARRQTTHGYTVEELRMVLKPMASEGKEPTFAMGDDTALAPLSPRSRPIAHYLHQRFAQVTNPPIDHLRERLVMSTRTAIGPRRPLLEESPAVSRLVELDSFLVFPSRIADLTDPERAPWPAVHLDATWPAADGPAGLARAVAGLGALAEEAVTAGAALIVIDNGGVGPDRAPVPALLAIGAVHQHLSAAGLRTGASLLCVADDIRDVHGVACLVGAGADAVCTRLALETVAAEADAADDSDIDASDAQERLYAALEDGVLKILSKMGIATVASYRGAQLHEAVGLAGDVVARCFPGALSVLGGVGWEHLGADILANHAAADWHGTDAPALPNPGWYRDLKRGGDHHSHNKAVVDALRAVSGAATVRPEGEVPAGASGAAGVAAHLLQRAIASADPRLYDDFSRLVDSRPATFLRDLLTLTPAGAPVPLEEVEPATSIVQRFSTGAMSHGSLSAEAHQTLAEAMNLLGGRSNCGEGGEDPARFKTRGSLSGDRNSRIKQIASGRFGVTPEYCAYADELQIKMAQGSKPGEGGQLPGHKVSDEIARLRHTQPGVTLISPPPHHDIYSIEDLAQLIFDLKQVNPFADVSVKLVAEHGVGTIAAGVVKALADVVQISGADGGTGASPLSSIKHAGLPWELGLAETQEALVANGLRDRVRVRVDGGLLTGRDVLIAALLGADEFSFGTAAMIAEGCIMLRACHKDTCTAGIATQRPHLRARFAGTPEGVATYLLLVADDVRRLLAGLGLRSVDDAVGRVECLRPSAGSAETGPAAGAGRSPGGATSLAERAATLDLGPLLVPPADATAPRRFVAGQALQRPRDTLGDRLLADGYRPVWDGDDADLHYTITNRDRTVGAALSGALALEFGSGPANGNVRVHLDGSAGQSFGAFLGAGVHLDLAGEANDGVGKGMAGGSIAIRPPAGDTGTPVLVGNTCLYGATGGALYIAGSAGERFGVRNSGATAVVEGAGDHACEYMTGGTVVILGPLGRNLGAGMTGGEAYVWDPDGALPGRLNPSLVEAVRLADGPAETLRWLIEQHLQRTGSDQAARLLASWGVTRAQSWLVAPLGRIRRQEAASARVVAAN
ncbi:glutamate synthase subunit alpha [Acidiferrimicrobium sp. IK]|uniref:glutamate synthase-related protein n=1 Tax=Acidiferrimicrobium sp. IK TaxID=2871700 RepID=UPI0021CB5F73|nr:glutamate synthase-related protein [Acidiferrimicrobium sp. IK]MCU4184566.1 glutamate synthase subunit alpha [Acidiferrimicrobium sp. IK]